MSLLGPEGHLATSADLLVYFDAPAPGDGPKDGGLVWEGGFLHAWAEHCGHRLEVRWADRRYWEVRVDGVRRGGEYTSREAAIRSAPEWAARKLRPGKWDFLPPEQLDALCARFERGADPRELAREFQISEARVRATALWFGAVRPRACLGCGRMLAPRESQGQSNTCSRACQLSRDRELSQRRKQARRPSTEVRR